MSFFRSTSVSTRSSIISLLGQLKYTMYNVSGIISHSVSTDSITDHKKIDSNFDDTTQTCSWKIKDIK